MEFDHINDPKLKAAIEWQARTNIADGRASDMNDSLEIALAEISANQSLRDEALKNHTAFLARRAANPAQYPQGPEANQSWKALVATYDAAAERARKGR